MDRLVWVGAFPSEDTEDVRSVVTAALEAGFDQIVLDRPADALERLGRFSPILLRDDAFLFDGQEVGRLATIRRGEDERAIRSLRGATKPWGWLEDVSASSVFVNGCGSARRSTLPAAETGSSPSRTKCAGTM